MERVERFYYGEEGTPEPNVPLHPGVSAVIFDAERRILIMQRPRGGYWSLPGGRMDMNELAQDCSVRETFEETGLHTEIVRLISVNTDPRSVVHYPDDNVHRSFVLCFEARVVGGSLLVSEELERFHWLAPDEINSFKLIPDTRYNVLDAWSDREAAFIR